MHSDNEDADFFSKTDYQEFGLDSSLFKVKQLTMLAQTLAEEDVAKIRYQKQVRFLNLIPDDMTSSTNDSALSPSEQIILHLWSGLIDDVFTP